MRPRLKSVGLAMLVCSTAICWQKGYANALGFSTPNGRSPTQAQSSPSGKARTSEADLRATGDRSLNPFKLLKPTSENSKSINSESLIAAEQPTDPRKAEADRLLERGIQLGREGMKLRQRSYYQASIQSLEQALDLYRQLQDRPGEARSLAYLGAAYLGLGDKTKAVALSQQAVELAKELQNPELEKLTVQGLAIAQKQATNPPQVLPLPEFFVGNNNSVVQKATNPPQALAQTSHLMRQGVQQFQTSQFEAALQSFQQALTLYRANKDRRAEAITVNTLGINYQWLGNLDKAIECHEQSLVIARELKDFLLEGNALNGLGVVYNLLSNYGKAIDHQEQHLAIAREIKDRRAEGNALNSLGSTYSLLGNYGRAIEYHKQSLAIAREIKNRRAEGDVLNSLGSTYSLLGNYGRAIEYHEQSLAITRELKDLLSEGIVQVSLGNTYASLGNYGRAIKYHERSLAIFRELKDRFREGDPLSSLGNAYASLGNYGKAVEYYEQSLALARELKDRFRKGKSLNNLGSVLFKLGKLSAAEKILLEGIVVRESIRQTGVGNNDANKVSIFETQASTYRILQQVLVAQNKTNAALEISERGRARAFVELLAQRLGNQASVIQPPNLQQIQQIAKQQNATLVQYSTVFDEFKTQGNQETRQSELYIWVIAPTGEITFRKTDLKPLWQQQNTSLSNLVEQSRETIGARGRSDIEVALSPERVKQQQEQKTQKLKQLHQILIEQIADRLPKDPNQRVIFMPQGELFLVPFPALLDANNKPLIETHTILTAPSIQVLELTRQQRDRVASRPAAAGKSLIVGNPTMPKIVTQVGDKPVQLSDLPGAKREAMAIAKLFQTEAITGAQATKTAIAQQMTNARFIHFATHGLLDDFKGLGVPGAIALAPSGNGQLNDGLLTSNEILDMKLNAELVVLSACDTGRGKITGDGVIGLSRSLITAGVPSIIVSLWKVPDEQTAFLMTEFYKNLQKSPDKAQALRQAMLTTKQNYPDPLNWAAFTLIGEAD